MQIIKEDEGVSTVPHDKKRLYMYFFEPLWKFYFIRNIYVIENDNKFKVQYLHLHILGFVEVLLADKSFNHLIHPARQWELGALLI